MIPTQITFLRESKRRHRKIGTSSRNIHESQNGPVPVGAAALIILPLREDCTIVLRQQSSVLPPHFPLQPTFPSTISPFRRFRNPSYLSPCEQLVGGCLSVP